MWCECSLRSTYDVVKRGQLRHHLALLKFTQLFLLYLWHLREAIHQNWRCSAIQHWSSSLLKTRTTTAVRAYSASWPTWQKFLGGKTTEVRSAALTVFVSCLMPGGIKSHEMKKERDVKFENIVQYIDVDLIKSIILLRLLLQLATANLYLHISIWIFIIRCISCYSERVAVSMFGRHLYTRTIQPITAIKSLEVSADA